MPTVTVIMPVYNGEAYVAEAIDSILAQTYSDFELIIVDDGSVDCSEAIIRRYDAREDRIRFIQFEENRGIADARNQAIAVARGQYITPMDCDDVSLPERLEKQVAFLQAHPEIGGVGIGARHMNEDLSQKIAEFTLPTCHGVLVLYTYIGLSFIFSAIMFRREYLAAVGGYQPGRRTGEERDLVWRLISQAGIRFANLGETLLLYRRHDQAMGATRDQRLQREVSEVFRRMLHGAWHEAPEDTLDRFMRLRRRKKLSWSERRAAKRDIHRLIDCLIERGWVEAGDRPKLLAASDQRLELSSPRIWQMFCHWRRHRLGQPRAQGGG